MVRAREGPDWFTHPPGKKKWSGPWNSSESSKAAQRGRKRVVIIGAGNVGCDAAAEAHRFGAGECA